MQRTSVISVLRALRESGLFTDVLLMRWGEAQNRGHLWVSFPESLAGSFLATMKTIEDPPSSRHHAVFLRDRLREAIPKVTAYLAEVDFFDFDEFDMGADRSFIPHGSSSSRSRATWPRGSERRRRQRDRVPT